MSLSCYLSRNARQYLQKARENTAREDNQLFLNIIEANLFRRILRIAGRNFILISRIIINFQRLYIKTIIKIDDIV